MYGNLVYPKREIDKNRKLREKKHRIQSFIVTYTLDYIELFDATTLIIILQGLSRRL